MKGKNRELNGEYKREGKKPLTPQGKGTSIPHFATLRSASGGELRMVEEVFLN